MVFLVTGRRRDTRKWLRGRASPCQGEGRGFESRLPLGVRLLVEWPRGEAAACKAVYTGSNPVSTSVRSADPPRSARVKNNTSRKWLRARASPCQGRGRGFESRLPLVVRLLVEWPRGEAAACKAVYTGSNPDSTSVPSPDPPTSARVKSNASRKWLRGRASPCQGEGR